jgi:predicted Fe-Mo cluster-binding NifX family protein
MKIAISSSGQDLYSRIDPRFGRCPHFIVVDTETMDFEYIDNESSAIGGGAGIQSAQFLASKGVKAIITGNCGPNAMTTLATAGIQVFLGNTGTVAEGVENFKSGNLIPAETANVPDHSGVAPYAGGGRMVRTGGGRGLGGAGMGGGRGMGMRGGGRGRGGGKGLS